MVSVIIVEIVVSLAFLQATDRQKMKIARVKRGKGAKGVEVTGNCGKYDNCGNCGKSVIPSSRRAIDYKDTQRKGSQGC